MEPEIVLELIDFYKGKLTQKTVLQALNISRTTFNRWKKELPKEKENIELVDLIKQICKKHKYRYG